MVNDKICGQDNCCAATQHIERARWSKIRWFFHISIIAALCGDASLMDSAKN